MAKRGGSVGVLLRRDDVVEAASSIVCEAYCLLESWRRRMFDTGRSPSAWAMAGLDLVVTMAPGKVGLWGFGGMAHVQGMIEEEKTTKARVDTYGCLINRWI